MGGVENNRMHLPQDETRPTRLVIKPKCDRNITRDFFSIQRQHAVLNGRGLKVHLRNRWHGQIAPCPANQTDLRAHHVKRIDSETTKQHPARSVLDASFPQFDEITSR